MMLFVVECRVHYDEIIAVPEVSAKKKKKTPACARVRERHSTLNDKVLREKKLCTPSVTSSLPHH